MTEAHLACLLSLALGWLIVMSNVFSFKSHRFFLRYLSSDLCGNTILSQRSTDNTFQIFSHYCNELEMRWHSVSIVSGPVAYLTPCWDWFIKCYLRCFTHFPTGLQHVLLCWDTAPTHPTSSHIAYLILNTSKKKKKFHTLTVLLTSRRGHCLSKVKLLHMAMLQ